MEYYLFPVWPPVREARICSVCIKLVLGTGIYSAQARNPDFGVPDLAGLSPGRARLQKRRFLNRLVSRISPIWALCALGSRIGDFLIIGLS